MTRSLLVLALLSTFPSDALACGGFFCDQAAPRDTSLFDPAAPRVDQTSEKIVFSIDEEAGKVVVGVQVAYEGNVDDFAWVVPVPAIPDLFIVPQALFDSLEAGTALVTRMTSATTGSCKFINDDVDEDASSDTDVAFSDTGSGRADNDTDTDGVTIVATQQVGPYQTVTLQADTAEQLVTWLEGNGFTLPDDSTAAMAGYVTSGAYFVALRLSKDRDVGDIAPFGMRYDGTKPQIPLSLTRIAATDDMRLVTWVLGSARAVPDNYLHVVPNLMLLDWWRGGANWRDLIARAADEAGGQAFATEYAGRQPMPTVWAEGWANEADLRATDNALDWLLSLRATQVANNPDTLAVLQRQIPTADVDPTAGPLDVYNCPRCFEAELRALPFDTGRATDALVAGVIAPARAAQRLLDEADWVTRLTSSMSPNEMVSDPIFVLNPDMPTVARTRKATLVTRCDEDTFWDDAPRELRIANGPTVPVPSRSWMAAQGWTWDTYLASLTGPKAERIEDTSSSGAPVTIANNSGAIAEALRAAEARFGVAADPDSLATAQGCGCATPGPVRGAGTGLIALMLGALTRRRRQG